MNLLEAIDTLENHLKAKAGSSTYKPTQEEFSAAMDYALGTLKIMQIKKEMGIVDEVE